MKIKTAIALIACICAACSTRGPDTPAKRDQTAKKIIDKTETTPSATSTALTLNGYKRDLAERIAEVNSTKVYVERPQALLRSVIVVKYQVGSDGKLVHAEIVRSNHDRATESTALASLQNTAPFPKPASHLLRNGRVEISETWLFNNDGRFQLRTIALPQMGE
ncbi:MAG: TonB family protein [Pseudomonadota bacterium]